MLSSFSPSVQQFGAALARRAVQISAEHGGFGVTLFPGDHLGEGLGALGDVNGDGVPDLGLAAPDSDWLGSDAGRAWTLFL